MAVSDEIKEQTRKLKDMTLNQKLSYIWEYYKIHIIVAVAVIITGCVLIRDVRENNKPTYLNAVFINSNFAIDTSNTLEDDFIRCNSIDTDNNHVYFAYDINFNPGYFDTTTIAYQQKLISMYQTNDLDIVAGPVLIMETSADCNGYGNLEEMLPADLLDELADRGYEFYTYKGRRYDKDELAYFSEEELNEIKNFEPYIAGIYLDTCSYLNNMGERGAWNVAESEDDRPILTIPANTQRLDKSIEFIRFIIE